MKFAIIKASGKQFKISEGDTLILDKTPGKPKDKITFDKVLLVVDKDKPKIGTPLVKNAKVTAEILSQEKAKKIKVLKFKAKSRYRKVKSHRSHITKVKIKKITS